MLEFVLVFRFLYMANYSTPGNFRVSFTFANFPDYIQFAKMYAYIQAHYNFRTSYVLNFKFLHSSKTYFINRTLKIFFIELKNLKKIETYYYSIHFFCKIMDIKLLILARNRVRENILRIKRNVDFSKIAAWHSLITENVLL